MGTRRNHWRVGLSAAVSAPSAGSNCGTVTPLPARLVAHDGVCESRTPQAQTTLVEALPPKPLPPDDDDEKSVRQLAMEFIRKPKKLSSGFLQLRQNNIYRAKVRILKACIADDSWVLTLANMLDEDNKESAADPKANPFWDESVRQVNRLPRYWMGEIIVEASRNEKLEDRWSNEDIRRIDKVSDTNVSAVFQFLTATHDGTAIPKSALRKETCRRMFLQLAARWGRTKGLKKHVNMAGAINWKKLGVYSITKVEGGQLMIRHCSGVDAAYPAHLSTAITDIPLEKNANDLLAALKFPGHPYFLKDAFPKGAGPQDPLILNAKGQQLKEMSDMINKEIVEQIKAEETTAEQQRQSEAELAKKLAENAKEVRQAKLRTRPTAPLKRKRDDTIVVSM